MVVPEDPELNPTAPYVVCAGSRFTGASIAGLVVGAMGVFVFTVALRHWLRERSCAPGKPCPGDGDAGQE